MYTPVNGTAIPNLMESKLRFIVTNVVHIFIDETVRKLTATVQQVGVHDIRLAEMDVRFQCLETANYEGVLIWKVADYARRRRDAFNDTVSPI